MEVKNRKKEEIVELNYAIDKTISYSQYLIYKRCKHQWYLNYSLKKYEFPPTIHTLFGKAMHIALQKYFETMFNVSGKKADELDIIEIFKNHLIEEYPKEVERNKGQHISSPEQLQEFYEDGISILNWIKKHRSKYFSIRNVRFIGAEIPLLLQADKGIPNVFFKGYIDMVLYDETFDEYIIFDFKTSTRGWDEQTKRDPLKVNQLLLYKRFFAQEKKIDEDKVKVKFIVLKRKIPTLLQYPIPKIQMFEPANGKNKVNKAVEDLNSFIEDVFDKEGRFQDKEYEKNLTACKWCPFNNKPDLCDRGESLQKKFFVNSTGDSN